MTTSERLRPEQVRTIHAGLMARRAELTAGAAWYVAHCDAATGLQTPDRHRLYPGLSEVHGQFPSGRLSPTGSDLRHYAQEVARDLRVWVECCGAAGVDRDTALALAHAATPAGCWPEEFPTPAA